MALRQKMKNLRLMSNEDFFLANTMIMGPKLVFILESQTISFPTHKVLHINYMTNFRGHRVVSVT